MPDNKKLRELFFKEEDNTHAYFDQLCLENNIDIEQNELVGYNTLKIIDLLKNS